MATRSAGCSQASARLTPPRCAIASRSGMAQRCSRIAIAAVVPGGIASARYQTSSPSGVSPASAAAAPASAPISAPSSPAAPKPMSAPVIAPSSSDSSAERSLVSIAWTSPVSSRETTIMSTRRTMSCSRRRRSSAAISPVASVVPKPTTRSCMGPNVVMSGSLEDLVLLDVELRLREHAGVEQSLEVGQLLHHVARGHRGSGGRRRRRVGLLRWRLLRLGDLLVLLVLVLLAALAVLAGGIGGPADHRGAHQRAAAH